MKHGQGSGPEEGVPHAGRSHEGMVAIVRMANAEILRLCGLLEEVADSLPGAIDRRTCLMLASELEPLVRGLHRFEEETLFPAYEQAMQARGKGKGTLERLRAEHIEDECFAGELTEALRTLGETGKVDNPEAMGFMLRGFFEAQRRHVAFEREHLLPAILRAP